MDYKNIKASIRRHWPVAILILLMVPVVMAIYLTRRDVVRPPARYTTSADLLIPNRDPETNQGSGRVPPVLYQGQTELALSKEVTGDALRRAGIDPAEARKISFNAKLSENRSIITLSVAAAQPEPAAAVLNDYIAAYQTGRRNSVLEAADELRSVQYEVIQSLTDRLNELEVSLFSQGVGFGPVVPNGSPVPGATGESLETDLLLYERNSILNEIQQRKIGYSESATDATAPGTFTTIVQRRSTAKITPPPPSPLIPLLEILAIGLALAIAVPVILDKADSTITEARAAPGALRSGTLATIPYMPRRLHRSLAPPGSSWELAFRALAATSISTDRLPRAIMVTSPAETTQDPVAANFAAALAGLGVKVALVATVPRQEWFLDDVDPDPSDGASGTQNGSGPPAAEPRPPSTSGGTTITTTVATFPELLVDAHNGRLDADIRPRLARREIDNLYIVPPGAEGAELLLDGLPPLLDALAQSEIDITVIAGPALLDDPNATIIAWSTRHVLWAIEIGHVNKNDAHLAADRLELAGVEPFGIALVNRSTLRT